MMRKICKKKKRKNWRKNFTNVSKFLLYPFSPFSASNGSHNEPWTCLEKIIHCGFPLALHLHYNHYENHRWKAMKAWRYGGSSLRKLNEKTDLGRTRTRCAPSVGYAHTRHAPGAGRSHSPGAGHARTRMHQSRALTRTNPALIRSLGRTHAHT